MYRADEIGMIRTFEEFYIEHGQHLPDSASVLTIWNTMTPIEVPPGKRDELQEKLMFLMRPNYGDLWLDPVKGLVIDPTKLLKIK